VTHIPSTEVAFILPFNTSSASSSMIASVLSKFVLPCLINRIEEALAVVRISGTIKLTRLKFGNLSASQVKTRDQSIAAIRKAWNVKEVKDAFPESIKPVQLGVTALHNIKAIARKIPNLTTAQALFLNECKDKDGAPVAVSFSHTKRIYDTLQAANNYESTSQTSTPAGSTRGKKCGENETVTPTQGPQVSASGVEQNSQNVPHRIVLKFGSRSTSSAKSVKASETLANLGQEARTSIVKRTRDPKKNDSDNLARKKARKHNVNKDESKNMAGKKDEQGVALPSSDNVFEDPIKPSVALVSPTSRIEVKHESCIRKLNLLILLILYRMVHWMLTRMTWRSLPRAMLKTIKCSLLDRHLKMITKRGKLWLNMHMPRK
jgi:hypothetical protein